MEILRKEIIFLRFVVYDIMKYRLSSSYFRFIIWIFLLDKRYGRFANVTQWSCWIDTRITSQFSSGCCATKFWNQLWDIYWWVVHFYALSKELFLKFKKDKHFAKLVSLWNFRNGQVRFDHAERSRILIRLRVRSLQLFCCIFFLSKLSCSFFKIIIYQMVCLLRQCGHLKWSISI